LNIRYRLNAVSFQRFFVKELTASATKVEAKHQLAFMLFLLSCVIAGALVI